MNTAREFWVRVSRLVEDLILLDSRAWRFACSVGALLLAASLWLSLVTGAGQPVRAVVVVAFLAAPGLLVARFLRGPGPAETVVFSLGGAAATWGLAALLTLSARQAWTPESALTFVSVVVGLVSAIDVWSRLRRRRKAVA